MAQDIGIDLGTANIVMAVNGKGVVLNEPSVIAVNKRTNKILAVGKKAYRMVGKSPEYISVIRPLSCGVISDDEMTQCLIREFVRKASGYRLIKPNSYMRSVFYYRRRKPCSCRSSYECRFKKGLSYSGAYCGNTRSRYQYVKSKGTSCS